MAEMWDTRLTKIKPNEIRVRGYRIDELMGRATFTEAIYLLLMGELPDEKVRRLLDAIFISSIDHGVTPPSAQATRLSTSTGAPMNAAVAAGVLCINDFHGGAIHNCMILLQETLSRAGENGSLDETAAALVGNLAQKRQRMPGLGHRIHTDDPRTARLFALAEEAGVSARGVQMIQAISQVYEKQGKAIPINVDGAIAAILVDLQIPSEYANAFFMIARLPGLCAHAFEEETTQPRMRNIQASYHAYAGPEDRSIKERS